MKHKLVLPGAGHIESAPMGRRPEEVPEIRSWLATHLAEGGSLDYALQRWNAEAAQVGRAAPTHPDVERTGLAEARLFWVPPEETEVIVSGSQDLPADMILTEDMVPSPSGFVVFAGDWYGWDARTGTKSFFPIRAMRWGPVSLPTHFPDDVPVYGQGVINDDHPSVLGIALSCYSASRDMAIRMAGLEDDHLNDLLVSLGYEPDQFTEIKLQLGQSEDVNHWYPLGRSDWALGEHWSHHALYKPGMIAYESIVEDRRIIAALWGLMAACPPIDVEPNRAERRRAARAGRTTAPVRVVTWRGPRGQRVASESDTEGRKVTKRYMVRQHWRHQAYGPERSLRRWILVPTHWRGPEDGELADPHEIVHKVVQR